MAGLVGLTLGLFIGWWVWPVEWTESPSSGPAASAPAQLGETQAVVSDGADSSYTALVDLISQGLLYVAALLLLVGGVIIANQLLRQSQGKKPPIQPFPLPFGKRRANQATAPREPKVVTPPLAARPQRQRRPSLDWLRKEPPSREQPATVEPVFTEQPDARDEREVRTSDSPVSEDVTASRAEMNPEPREDFDNTEDWSGQNAGNTTLPDQPPVGGDYEPTGPVLSGDAETVASAYGEEEVESPGEGTPTGQESVEAPTAFAGFQEGSGEEESDTSRIVQPDANVTEPGDRRQDENLGFGKPVEGAIQSETGPAEEWARDEAPEDNYRAQINAGALVELPDRRMEAAPYPSPALEPFDRDRGHVLPEQDAHSPRKQVGEFEASYAFGIQSYDESFTINATDGELLGACGVGINESVDRDAANSDQVRLLDIWLYDRSSVQSVSQPLVSPGFSAGGLIDLGDDGETESAAPLEVTPGLTCTLRSDSILLECRIESVTFLEDEPGPPPIRSMQAKLSVFVLL